MKKKSILCLLLLLPSLALADSGQSWQAITASFGMGRPNKLRGARISYAIQPGFLNYDPLSVYFDFSGAYWSNSYHKYKSMFVIALAPVLRWTITKAYKYRPYLEASVGGAWLSRQHFGHRDLGSPFNFQDMLGGGVNFGDRHQYDLAIHYLHYSNAGLAPPNNGIDVKMLLTFAYRY
ncbi:MAG: acyloxyacyl hydrolase [Gammaproteobacteria bacterium]|nr:acyloxyacyl hydrolase [Gammaproteobacteria bacterium]